MTLSPKNNSKHLSGSLRALIGFACVFALTGCQSINYKEMAYSALRHQDCQLNELETFCTRSYQREYYEYERMRNEFLHDTDDTTGTQSSWRTSENPTSKPPSIEL